MEVSNHKFTTKDYLEFIRLYEYHKCLWNKQDSDYKNRNKRNKAYENIKNKMNLVDVNMVKKKIKIIRDTYNIEKQKIKKSYDKGSPNQIYKPRIPWFDAIDSFIYTFSCKKKIKADKDKKELSAAHLKKITIFSDDEKFCEKPENISCTQLKNINSVLYSLPKEETKRIRCNLLSSSNVKSNNREVEELNTTSLLSKNHDEFYYFAMNLAQQLRQLPLKNALASQYKIQKIIARERIHCENNIPKISTEAYYFSPSTPSSLYNENHIDVDDNYDNNLESIIETEETKPMIKNI